MILYVADNFNILQRLKDQTKLKSQTKSVYVKADYNLGPTEANIIWPTGDQIYDMFFKFICDNFTAWVYGPPLKCSRIFGMPEESEKCFEQATKMAYDYGAVASPTTSMYQYWARMDTV